MTAPDRLGLVPALAAALVLGSAVVACTGDAGPVTNPEAISVESPFRYPIGLWDAGAEGESIVMVHVTDTGAVDSVYVLDPSGEAAFDSAAVQGARKLKFDPGRRGDRRVAMWVKLPVRFRQPASPSAGGRP